MVSTGDERIPAGWEVTVNNQYQKVCYDQYSSFACQTQCAYRVWRNLFYNYLEYNRCSIYNEGWSARQTQQLSHAAFKSRADYNKPVLCCAVY